MSYNPLKTPAGVLQCSSRHLLLYWCDFMTNKIFQFVSGLWSTFKDLNLKASSEEVTTKG